MVRTRVQSWSGNDSRSSSKPANAGFPLPVSLDTRLGAWVGHGERVVDGNVGLAGILVAIKIETMVRGVRFPPLVTILNFG